MKSGFLGLETRLLCSKVYVDSIVIVVDYVVVGWCLEI